MMKKRPFLDRFLALCSEFCQMIVYTAGTRSSMLKFRHFCIRALFIIFSRVDFKLIRRYAEAVQRIIDPTRRYFGDRLVSRSDGAGAASGPNNSEPTTNLFIHKSLERIFLGRMLLSCISLSKQIYIFHIVFRLCIGDYSMAVILGQVVLPLLSPSFSFVFCIR